MKIGLVGGSSQQRSLPFNAERTVNLYPVLDEQGKEVAALYGTPGLITYTEVLSGPIRGEFAATNGRAFVVSGFTLFEINQVFGGGQVRGTLATSSGIVTIEENGFQLSVCDSARIYVLRYSDNSFTTTSVTDAGTITFIDGYTVYNQNGTGTFHISSLYDSTVYPALDFATAESSPDQLLRVYNALGQLWLFGALTTEIWTNTGDSTFPFERINGGKIDVGILSPHSAVDVDNAVIWLGRDKKGQGIVYKSTGFVPQRISTNAIELLIQRANMPDQIRAYAYQKEGHTFYKLTGGGLETSPVFDLSTQLWHERALLNDLGEYEQHIACCHMFAFGKHLVGSRLDGKIYELSQDAYSDADSPLVSDRIYTHLSDEGKRIRFNTLEIGVETGVGLEDTSVPVIMMRLSKDGGKRWTDWTTASIGPIGEYLTKVRFRRLGVASQMTFQIRITDPVKRAICGSYLQ